MKLVNGIKEFKMGKLISVVVPIYNVEQYIVPCIESIIKQTYQNLEILLIDDGSPDNCGRICEQYKQKDSRIKVVHKQNGGLSDARNCGLKLARGEYIIFIDSDDFVSTELIEKLYFGIVKENAEIAACYFEKVYDDKENIGEKEICKMDSSYTSKELLKRLYTDANSPIAFVAWNKLYKKSLFTENNILYPFGKYHEDTFTTYKLIYSAKRIAIISEVLYYYRIRKGSIMTEAFSIKRLDNLLAMSNEIEYYSCRGEKELSALAFNRYCGYCIRVYYQIKESRLKDFKNIQNMILIDYKKVWDKYNGRIELPNIKKIIYWMFIFKPRIVSQIYRKYCLLKAGTSSRLKF